MGNKYIPHLCPFQDTRDTTAIIVECVTLVDMCVRYYIIWVHIKVAFVIITFVKDEHVR